MGTMSVLKVAICCILVIHVIYHPFLIRGETVSASTSSSTSSSTSASTSSTPSSTFTCDELISNLCSLAPTKGSLLVRGLSLTYWTYNGDPDASHQYLRSSPASEILPLIVIHGGPAYTHNYLLTLKQQACRGRTVVFYDQVGCGESWRPAEQVKLDGVAPWLLTLDYYVEELHALTTHLHLANYILLGHSWGGMVAQMYALSPHAELSLHGVVLASTLSDAQFYGDEQRRVRHTTLPPFIQTFLKSIEASKDYENPKYKELVKTLTTFWTIRTSPMPDCVQRCHDGLNEEIYVRMQGASEFTVGGVMTTFNITEQLSKIRVPTFVTYGRYDTMVPTVNGAMLQRIPDAIMKEYRHSGHMTMIDDVEEYNNDIAVFFTYCDVGEVISPIVKSKSLNRHDHLKIEHLRFAPSQSGVVVDTTGGDHSDGSGSSSMDASSSADWQQALEAMRQFNLRMEQKEKEL